MTHWSKDVETALRRSADMFHEIGMALAAKDLLVNCTNEVVAKKLRDDVRTPKQLEELSADGFELCVAALVALGASDVSIQTCGASATGEAP